MVGRDELHELRRRPAALARAFRRVSAAGVDAFEKASAKPETRDVYGLYPIRPKLRDSLLHRHDRVSYHEWVIQAQHVRGIPERRRLATIP